MPSEYPGQRLEWDYAWSRPLLLNDEELEEFRTIYTNQPRRDGWGAMSCGPVPYYADSRLLNSFQPGDPNDVNIRLKLQRRKVQKPGRCNLCGNSIAKGEVHVSYSAWTNGRDKAPGVYRLWHVPCWDHVRSHHHELEMGRAWWGEPPRHPSQEA